MIFGMERADHIEDGWLALHGGQTHSMAGQKRLRPTLLMMERCPALASLATDKLPQIPRHLKLARSSPTCSLSGDLARSVPLHLASSPLCYCSIAEICLPPSRAYCAV